jgi:hypothetical protein
MDGNCHVFANCRWAILSPFLLDDSSNLCISQRLSYTLKNFPEVFQKPLGISQRLSFTLLAVPSGYPTAFKSISLRLSAKTWQFPSLFSEGPRFF